MNENQAEAPRSAEKHGRHARPGSHHGARNARVLAFKVLYEVDIARHSAVEVFDRQDAQENLRGNDSTLARDIVRGVLSHRGVVDQRIQEHAPSWPIDQLSAVERNILRIATYELLFNSEQVPTAVSINEAVELAKMFGGDAASRFINGVLGQIARTIEHTQSTSSETTGDVVAGGNE